MTPREYHHTLCEEGRAIQEQRNLERYGFRYVEGRPEKTPAPVDFSKRPTWLPDLTWETREEREERYAEEQR